MRTLKTKIVSRAALVRAVSRLHARGKRVVFTNGCFDIMHAGHVTYLEKARSLGDILVVALNSDRSVRKLKGPSRPINTEQDRARVMAALACVDYVTIFGEPTPAKLIERVAPDVLAKGGDWKTADIVGGVFVKSRGGKVVSIPLVKGRSTTTTLRRIASL